MFIVARKEGQSVAVEIPSGVHDKKIMVVVVEIKGNAVRLGIEADSSVRVERVNGPDSKILKSEKGPDAD